MLSASPFVPMLPTQEPRNTPARLACALATVLLFAGHAQAQNNGGIPGPFGGGGWFLLTDPGVHRELKATDQQSAELKDLVDAGRAKFRVMVQESSKLPADERNASIRSLSRESNEDLRAGLAQILKPEQVLRFDQIVVQAAGMEAFAIDRVRSQLKLTGEQDKQILEVNSELRKSQMVLRDELAADRAVPLKKLLGLRKQSVDQVVGLLSDEQKATWKRLVGEPYEVTLDPTSRPGPGTP